MLIAFGGLPGTGKTTLSRRLAVILGATYLRIDAIEQAIRDAGPLAGDVGPAGYGVAQALAASNLDICGAVVADSVNPVAASRQAWRDIARRAGAPLIEIETVCSDRTEHRRRVETRLSDVPGLRAPTWAQIMQRDYEPWTETHIVIDTAHIDPEAAILQIRATIDASRPAGRE